MTTILEDVQRFGAMSKAQEVLITATLDYVAACEKRRELEAAGLDMTAARAERDRAWERAEAAKAAAAAVCERVQTARAGVSC
jgi:hypothetical protein